MFIGDCLLVSTAVLPPNNAGRCWLCRMPCYAAGDPGAWMAVPHIPHVHSHQRSISLEKLCFVKWRSAQEWDGWRGSLAGSKTFVLCLSQEPVTQRVSVAFHVVFHLSLGFEQSLGAPRNERASSLPKEGWKPRGCRAVPVLSQCFYPSSGIHPFPGEDGRCSFSLTNSEKSNLKH